MDTKQLEDCSNLCNVCGSFSLRPLGKKYGYLHLYVYIGYNHIFQIANTYKTHNSKELAFSQNKVGLRTTSFCPPRLRKMYKNTKNQNWFLHFLSLS